MLAIRASPHRLCDGLARRDFLRIGALGGLGLTLPTGSAAGSGSRAAGRAKRCLLLFLTGGPPQLDTFDMKPSAPAEIRGELQPIATSVPGIRISELCPRLAQLAQRYCIVRSVTHNDTVHTSAGYTMLTGVRHLLANAKTAEDIRPNNNDHPHLGALLAKTRPKTDGTPVFASLPEVIKDANVNEFPGQDGGFMGKQFGPFRIEANTERTGFRLPDIVLPSDMTADRMGDRRLLLGQLNQTVRGLEMQLGGASDLNAYYRQAYDLIRAPAVQRAFQVEREPDRLRAAYGSHLFGQGCLLARRLLEAGVSLVTVYWHYEGPDDSPVWDTHWNNFKHLRNRLLPPADQAIATVFEDFAARGLLEDTLVIVMGEFGRTPKINKEAGRDHWPHVQSILLAGAGIRPGCVYGASDRHAAYPTDNPVTPEDLMATCLHLLGVPAEMELHDRTGRPVRACEGKVVSGLLS